MMVYVDSNLKTSTDTFCFSVVLVPEHQCVREEKTGRGKGHLRQALTHPKTLGDHGDHGPGGEPHFARAHQPPPDVDPVDLNVKGDRIALSRSLILPAALLPRVR